VATWGGGELEDLAAELEALAERLADLALDRLRLAAHRDLVDDPEAAVAAAEERRITRARRAVEKAAALLAPQRRDHDADGP
jgi:hypothetical protein